MTYLSLDFAKKKNWEISSLSIEVAISLPSLFSWDEKKHSSFKFLLTQAGLTERSTSWGIRMRSTEWIKRNTAPNLLKIATINYFPPNSMVMFGVIFWFTFHLIWKYYVLHWVFLLFFGIFVPVCLEESGMSCGNKSRPSLGLDLCIWRSDGKGSKVDWKWRIKFWPFYFWRPYQKCSFVGLCLLIQSTKILLYGKTLKEKTQSLIYICTIIYERLSKGDFFPLFCLIEILIVSKNKIFITTSATYDSKEVIFKPMEIWNWRVFFLSVSKENSNKYIKTFSSWTEPDEIHTSNFF